MDIVQSVRDTLLRQAQMREAMREVDRRRLSTTNNANTQPDLIDDLVSRMSDLELTDAVEVIERTGSVSPHLLSAMANLHPFREEISDQTAGETYWPNIRRYLVSRAGPCPLILCGICTEPLEIEGLQRGVEPWRLLRCGHVIGLLCVTLYLDTCATTADMPNIPLCPFCRSPM